MKLIFTFCFTAAVLIVSKVTDVSDKISSLFTADTKTQTVHYNFMAGDNAGLMIH